MKFPKHVELWKYCIAVVLKFFLHWAPATQIVSYSWLRYSQDLAEHLVIHGHCLTSTDHKELSSLFNLGQESSRWAMDRRVALAMANLNIPQNWNVLGSLSGDGESRIMLSCWTGIPVQIWSPKSTLYLVFITYSAFSEQRYLISQNWAENLEQVNCYTVFLFTSLLHCHLSHFQCSLGWNRKWTRSHVTFCWIHHSQLSSM